MPNSQFIQDSIAGLKTVIRPWAPPCWFEFAQQFAGFDDDELGCFSGANPTTILTTPAVDIVLSGRFVVELDEIGLLRIRTLNAP